MAFLSAFLSYILMATFIYKINKEEKFSLKLFRALIAIFVVTFCVWIILNVAIKLVDSTLAIVLWLILMILPAIKMFMKKQ